MAKKRQSPQGILTAPAKTAPKAKKKLPAQGKRPFLNARESQVVNRRVNQDLRLARQGGQQLGDLERNFAQDIDFGALPQAPGMPDWEAAPSSPVGQDFAKWRQDQIDQNYQTYMSKMEPEFAQELDEFEQAAANRGWVPGSDVYNREKSRIEARQGQQKQEALTTAQNTAGQNAQQFFNIGTTARGNALQEMTNRYGFGRQYRGDVLSDIQQQRYNPLQEYQMLSGAQSGLAAGNLQYSQNAQQAERNNAAAMRQAMALRPPAFGGFGSPQEQAAFEDARYRDRATFEAQLRDQYTPRQDNSTPWYNLAGQVGGSLLGGWAQGGFSSPWG